MSDRNAKRGPWRRRQASRAGRTSRFQAPRIRPELTVLEERTLLASPTNGQFVPISPVEGQAFDSVVATFQDPDGTLPTDYVATIDWGNNKVTFALITTNPVVNNGYRISGLHRYDHEGTFHVNVTLTLKATGQPVVFNPTLEGDVTVQDATITAKASSVVQDEGLAYSGPVATFTDANPFGVITDYFDPANGRVPVINWGDGSAPDTTGSITGNNITGWKVLGSHTYREFGNYSVTVDIVGGSTSTAHVTTPAKIADAAITVTPSAELDLVEGEDFTGVLATYTDANPLGVPGDFTATVKWGDGSATEPGVITERPDGVFEVRAANPHFYRNGSYTIDVSLVSTKAGGKSGATSIPVHASDAAVSATAQTSTLLPLEGQAFSGVVAYFTDANVHANRPDLPGGGQGWGDGTALIDWGDGTPLQPGSITYDSVNDRYVVTGTQKIYKIGTYPITVTIIGNGGATDTTGEDPVTDPPAKAVVANGSVVVTAETLPDQVEGVQFSGVVATITDANPISVASNFEAFINWGDVVTKGVVTKTTLGQFTVSATRVFALGTQNFGITVTDLEAKSKGIAPWVFTTSNPGQVTVKDAPITEAKGAGTLIANEGQTFSSTLATFKDGNPSGVPAQFTATIDWGDGTTSGPSETVVGRALGGAFGVSASHALGVGAHTVTITITSKGDPTNKATVTTNVVVANAALKLVGASRELTQGESVSGVVATLTDSNPSQAASAYDVTIDWGDGSPPLVGKLVSRGGGHFDVQAQTPHAYARPGDYTITLHVGDGQGGTATATSEVLVTNAPLASAFQPFAATEKAAFSGVLATFSDLNALAASDSYSARIAWGDGTSTDGVLERTGNGKYTVRGEHTYSQAGPHDVLVTITDGEGGLTTAFGTVQVADRITTVVGRLDPADDHGPSASDGITNVSAPRFHGTAEPGDTVTLYAVRGDLPFPLVIASARVQNDGSWIARSVPLTDGVYTIYAAAADDAGRSSSPAVRLSTSPGGLLAIDTQAPRVVGTSLDPRTGRVAITMQDNLVGLDQAGLINPANYMIGLSSRTGTTPLAITAIAASPGAYNTPQTVSLETGQRLRSGGYIVSISGTGVTDLAGNALNGGFFAPASRPGVAFVAQLDTDGNLASGPILPQLARNNFPRTTAARARFFRR